jgi:predicted lysophospholipase L1 biosynthesis ABC-type transport system permease subunit
VATFTAAVAANEVVTIQVMNSLGQAVVLGVMFVFVSVIGAAVAVDIFSRSNQTVATLRSIGAQRGSISTSILASVLVFACAGSAAGALLGTGLGSLSIFGAIGTPGLMGAILDAVLVLGLTAVASGVGVYIGVRAAWRN